MERPELRVRPCQIERGGAAREEQPGHSWVRPAALPNRRRAIGRLAFSDLVGPHLTGSSSTASASTLAVEGYRKQPIHSLERRTVESEASASDLGRNSFQPDSVLRRKAEGGHPGEPNRMIAFEIVPTRRGGSAASAFRPIAFGLSRAPTPGFFCGSGCATPGFEFPIGALDGRRQVERLHAPRRQRPFHGSPVESDAELGRDLFADRAAVGALARRRARIILEGDDSHEFVKERDLGHGLASHLTPNLDAARRQPHWTILAPKIGDCPPPATRVSDCARSCRLARHCVMEFGDHSDIDLPFERHDEARELSHSNPLPVVELVTVDLYLGV